MSTFFAPIAWVDGKWKDNVRFQVHAGIITSIQSNQAVTKEDYQLQGVVLPGIPNVHSHASQRVIVGRTEKRLKGKDSHFWSWREEMYAAALSIEPEDLTAITQYLALELLQSGYTELGEFHYLHKTPKGALYDDPTELSSRIIDAARQVGIRVTLLPALYQWSGFSQAPPLNEQKRFIQSIDEYAYLVDSLMSRYQSDSLTKIGYCAHSLRAVSPDELRDLCSMWQACTHAPMHIHISEQRTEVEQAIFHLGARPVEWLLEHAPVNEQWCLVHATHLNEDECRGIAQSGAVVGLCPSTEANLGDGIFPLAKYVDEGGVFAIGSDSQVGVNPWSELKLLEYSQRLLHEKRCIGGGVEAHIGTGLFKTAIKGGALALGSPRSLILGGLADFIVLDKDDPSLWGIPREAWLDALIFGTRKPFVQDVFIAGKPVIQKGRHRNQEQIAFHYRKTVERLLKGV